MSSAEVMVVARWLRRKRTGVSMWPDMAEPTLRRARSGDGLAFVRLHEELGESYADLAPELFRRPVTAGLVEEFEALVAADDERALHLIAEVDGEPAAILGARLLAPDEDREQQIDRDASSTR